MKNFCLLGHNIQYSISPKVHSLIYAELGFKATYELFDVADKDFESSLPRLFYFDGFNVTKPYKSKIIPHLIAVDNKRFDAVNTVKNSIGYNTDYGGFFLALKSITDISGLNALVLGAGGVAEVVVPALKALGAGVNIYNRTYQSTLNLAKKNNTTALQNPLGKFDIIVNCTSVGLNAGENCAKGIDFSEAKIAYDTIYFDTEFLKFARKAGVSVTANGLGMLVYQAILANEIFFDTKIKNKIILANKIMQQLYKLT